MRHFVLARTQLPQPDIAWRDATGKKFTLAKFDGKVVLLNYWASWCEVCTRELPSIDRLQAKLAGDDFTVVAMNVDVGGQGVAERHAKRLKLKNLALYLDTPQQTMQQLGLQVMPTTYLFDQKGFLLSVYRGGAEWDSPEAVNLIKYFVDRPDFAHGLVDKTS